MELRVTEVYSFRNTRLIFHLSEGIPLLLFAGKKGRGLGLEKKWIARLGLEIE